MIPFLIIVIVVLVIVVICQYMDHRKKEKQIISLSSYLSRVQDGNESVPIDEAYEGNLFILQSEIYKTANRLQAEYAAEQKTNVLLKDLLADVSHQIKTPLSALTLMTDNLEKEDLTEKEKQICLRSIHRQIDHIRILIRNLLISSEIDAGVFVMHKEDLTLSSLIDRAVDPLQALTELHGIAFNSSLPEDIRIHADPNWFAEAIANILKNCIEHTKEGGSISITATSNNVSTTLRIEDTGEGMSEETASHMFERFYKHNNVSDNNGIGMYLSKQIIQLHSGTIQVSSTLGKGTVFHIKIYSSETM